jgi:hypothetical protein
VWENLSPQTEIEGRLKIQEATARATMMRLFNIAIYETIYETIEAVESAEIHLFKQEIRSCRSLDSLWD